MHPLHDYISKQLAERLKARKVVVWYDVRREFASFTAELRGSARTSDEAVPVTVSGMAARLAEVEAWLASRRATPIPRAQHPDVKQRRTRPVRGRGPAPRGASPAE